MPKTGMEPVRREQLIGATLQVVAEHGFAHATVARISAAAGVSTGIISHYFGDKGALLAESMRHILCTLKADVLQRKRQARTPRAQLRAMLDGACCERQFSPTALAAWLAFWSQSPWVPELGRLQRIHARRVHSNLVHTLRQLLPPAQARAQARLFAACVDGLSLHASLDPQSLDGTAVRALLSRQLLGIAALRRKRAVAAPAPSLPPAPRIAAADPPPPRLSRPARSATRRRSPNRPRTP